MTIHNNYTRFVLIFFVSVCNQVYAQKLPNIQKDNQWLPDTAKVDGKLTEWNGKLKALNKATGLEYLLGNNADQLYLALRSTNVGATAKIMAGGITFAINTAGRKKATEPSITVPVTNSSYMPTEGGGLRSNFSIMTDSVVIAGAIRNFKFIKVLNFKGVTDTLQSIYNEYGIKTRMTYDGAALVCEMMIPRALIGLSDLSTSFTYQVKLNGVPLPNFAGTVPPPPPTPPANRAATSVSYILAETRTATDFSGEYILATKP